MRHQHHPDNARTGENYRIDVVIEKVEQRTLVHGQVRNDPQPVVIDSYQRSDELRRRSDQSQSNQRVAITELDDGISRRHLSFQFNNIQTGAQRLCHLGRGRIPIRGVRFGGAGQSGLDLPARSFRNLFGFSNAKPLTKHNPQRVNIGSRTHRFTDFRIMGRFENAFLFRGHVV